MLDSYEHPCWMHSMNPPPPFFFLLGVGSGVLSLRTNFEKGGGLTGSQFLEGVTGKEGVTFLGGLQFLLKK